MARLRGVGRIEARLGEGRIEARLKVGRGKYGGLKKVQRADLLQELLDLQFYFSPFLFYQLTVYLVTRTLRDHGCRVIFENVLLAGEK